jgi:hypothetical protein
MSPPRINRLDDAECRSDAASDRTMTKFFGSLFWIIQSGTRGRNRSSIGVSECVRRSPAKSAGLTSIFHDVIQHVENQRIA